MGTYCQNKHLRQKREYNLLCLRIAQHETALARLQEQIKGCVPTVHEANQLRAMVAHIARMKTHHHPCAEESDSV